MLVNSNKLKGKITEQGYTMKEVAAKIGIRQQTLSIKLHNKSSFRADEMVKLCGLLNITDIKEYFYTD